MTASSTPPPTTPPPSGWVTPEVETGPAPGIEYAPHGARLVAYIIDAFLIGVITTALLVLGAVAIGAGISYDEVTKRVSVSTISGLQWLIFAISWILAVLVGLLYFPWFWARGGQTLGMRPFGLVVVRDADGGRIGWGSAILRLIGLWVSAVVVYIGFIWIFIDKRHRGWQDLIAGTVMIKR